MAGRHLLMRRLGTLARQLSSSESSRSAPGVASLVQVCSVGRSSNVACSSDALLCMEWHTCTSTGRTGSTGRRDCFMSLPALLANMHVGPAHT